MMPRLKFLFSAILLAASHAAPVYAETSAEPYGPSLKEAAQETAEAGAESGSSVPQLMTQNEFSKLEGIGLFKRPSDGSLGNDLWDGATRSRLIQLLQTMPASSPDPAAQRLIQGLLLSDSDTSKILNDVEPQSGPDLLSLRMQKLLEGGYYSQALTLYSKLNGGLSNVHLAESGIKALLFGGEKSLACVEAETALGAFKGSSFLSTIGDYCNYSLNNSDAANSATPFPETLQAILKDPQYGLAYSREAMNRMSDIERAVLAAENRISAETLTPDLIKELPARDIQILLRASNLTPEHELRLTTAGVAAGVLPSDDLRRLYVAAMEPAAGKEFVLPEQTSLQSWQQLPYYFYLAGSAPSASEKWKILREALTMADSYGNAALTPFAPLFDECASALFEAPPTAREASQVFMISDAAGHKMKPEWVLAAQNLFKSGAQVSEKEGHLVPAAVVSGRLGAQEKADLAKIIENMDFSSTAHKIFLISVIENIDKQSLHSDNASIIYENGLDRHVVLDASIPSPRLWDALKEAEKNRIKGEVALLSSLIVGNRPLENNYPTVFADILNALNTVGLTRLSEDLAMSAVLKDTD